MTPTTATSAGITDDAFSPGLLDRCCCRSLGLTFVAGNARNAGNTYVFQACGIPPPSNVTRTPFGTLLSEPDPTPILRFLVNASFTYSRARPVVGG
jgi:hypothetical protein